MHFLRALLPHLAHAKILTSVNARAQVRMEMARMDMKIKVSRSFGAAGESDWMSCLYEGGKKTDHPVFNHRC